jgi:hypothetical protein
MSRFMIGSGGFEYKYDIGKKSIDLSLLSAVSGVGVPLFALEYLVSFESGAPEAVAFDDLEPSAGIDGGAPPILYEGSPGQDPQRTFEQACGQALARVDELLARYAGRDPTRVELRAQARFRLAAAEWSKLLEWLNAYLPAALKLTSERLEALDLKAIERFDPDEDGEGDEGAGTRQAAFLCAASSERYLPYLGLRILSHAVQHKLDPMLVEETDRLWRGTLWKRH